MVCKNCGTENLAGSIFCSSCGSRIDGKKKCPSCNYLNEETNAYCNQCGARIDGKKICSNCGGEVIGAFCTKCGVKYGENIPSTSTKQSVNALSYTSKILDIVGNSVLLLGAVLSFIFIFFIEFNSTINEKEYSLFYFFYDAYKDLLLTYPEKGFLYTVSSAISGYTPIVLASLIIGICLICSLIFIILAIVKYVKKVCFGGEKGPALVSFLTIIFYILCVMGLKIIFNMQYKAFEENLVAEYLHNLAFNEITETGLTISIICALVYYVIAIINNAITLEKSKIMNFVFTIINTLLLITLSIFVCNAFIKLKIGEDFEEYVELITSFSVLANGLSLLSSKEEMITAVIMSEVIQIIFIMVLFLTLLNFAKTVNKNKNCLSYSITSMVLLLVAMVSSIIVMSLYVDYISKVSLLSTSKDLIKEVLRVDYTSIIIPFVISIISLVLCIVQSALNSKLKNKVDF